MIQGMGNIIEFNSTFLQRHYKDVLRRVLSDKIVCITSGEVKFFILNQEFLDEILSKSGKKIIEE